MRRWIKFSLIGAIFLSAWTLFSPHLATHLIVERPLDKADAILVLSGSAVYKERTAKAAELYHEGLAPLIIITNDGTNAGWFSGEQQNPPYVELERRALVANGVPPEAIVQLPGVVAGTDDEAKAIAAEIEARCIRSLGIVTSAYHTRRALWTFDRILADKHIAIGIRSAPPGDRTPGPLYWWLTPRGWQTVAGEYVKIAVYYAYY